MPRQEKGSGLERIVDACSAVGTTGLLFASVSAVAGAFDAFMASIVFADTAYIIAYCGSWLNEKRNRRIYMPSLYLGTVGICATVIDASYFSYIAYQYAVPGLIQIAERFS